MISLVRSLKINNVNTEILSSFTALSVADVGDHYGYADVICDNSEKFSRSGSEPLSEIRQSGYISPTSTSSASQLPLYEMQI